jgi:hypothetical protein
MGIFEKDTKKDKHAAPVDHAVDSSSAGDREAQIHTEAKKRGTSQDDVLAGSAPLRDGATTTTTTDSLRDQGGVETQSPNDLDQRTPEERLEQVRGWKKKIGPRQPQSADWDDFDQIVGTGSIADARRPT